MSRDMDSLCDIFKDLRERGCCKRCILRYLPMDVFKPYENPDNLLSSLDISDEPEVKRIKVNPCSVCVGIFEDDFIDKCIGKLDLELLKTHKIEAFRVVFSPPSCIYIRDRSMRIYLKTKYTDIYNDKLCSFGIAWLLSIRNKFDKATGKKTSPKSDLTISFELDYSLNFEEISTLGDYLSGKGFKDFMQNLSDDDFQTIITIPPKPAFGECSLDSIKYINKNLFFKGQYRKYSRALLQIPYQQKGETFIRTSTQSIICDAFQEVLGKQNFEFRTYGMDEVKTRILGEGKSFYVQLRSKDLAMAINCTDEKCRQIEDILNKDQRLSVHNLKQCEQTETKKAIAVESIFSKKYKVLCTLAGQTDVSHCIDIINALNRKLIINQQTPIRHLTQRRNKQNRKIIFSINAKEVENYPYVIEMDILAEMGLFIEEFLHGDLGRTKPSLNKIINSHLALNAIDIVSTHDTRIEEINAKLE